MVIELLSNAHNISEMDFGDLPQIWKEVVQNVPFADFHRPKLDLCTNFQKKHRGGGQNILVEIELLGNANDISEMDFGVLPYLWK